MAKTRQLSRSAKQATAAKDDKGFLDTVGLDYRDLKYDRFLANLQGNILKGHGRDNTVHMLVEFTGEPKDVKRWIGEFGKEKVTSFKEQLRQREVFRRNGVAGGLFAGIYLSARFYADFGIDASVLANNESFLAGMANRERLGDVDTYLEEAYKPETKGSKGKRANRDQAKQVQKPQRFHAMILLAHANLIDLNTAAKEICDAFSDYDPDNRHGDTKNPIATIVTTEYGSAIRNANGDGLEHFGYVDGISQPLFLKEDIEEYRKNNVDEWSFDPSANLGLVLVRDTPAKTDDAWGSYFVYRKLEQNVREFKHHEHELADKLNLPEWDEERVGAMIVGRFEDGTPLTLSGEDKMISSGIMNNFNYGADGEGLKCPFHAHIRKTNPRRGAEDNTHRMARRGITYGHRNVSTTIENHFVQMPTSGVGLLFMSFQADIEKQFEHIQARWANNDDHPQKNVGLDLVIGPEKGNRFGRYPKRYDDPNAERPRLDFKNFVTLKGGDYFFAPSIPFLKSLAPDKDSE